MLSWDEEDYLNKVLDNKVVVIKPFDFRITKIAENIVHRIHLVVPELEVRHMGASALKISGQNDIDIYIFCEENKFGNYLSKIEKIFGEKISEISLTKWQFNVDGYEVEMYLTDPNLPTMKKQIDVFEVLKNDQKLRKEYEKLKENLNGKPFKEYQRRKYEFYHRILDK